MEVITLNVRKPKAYCENEFSYNWKFLQAEEYKLLDEIFATKNYVPLVTAKWKKYGFGGDLVYDKNRTNKDIFFILLEQWE